MTWVTACDFSYSKPNLPALWAGGVRVILGYLSDTPGKGLTQAYVDQALALGFGIVPLYETTAQAALGGKAAGITAATTATRIAARLGCPAAVPIVYALDADYTAAQMAGPVSAYITGLHAVAGLDGEYGGYRQLSYLVAHKIDVGRLFQTYAWSNGAWLSAGQAPIEQYRNGVTLAGATVDLCRIDLTTLTIWEHMAAIDSTDILPLDWQTDMSFGIYDSNSMHDTYTGGSRKGQPIPLVAAVKSIEKTLAAVTTNGSSPDVTALVSAVAALTAQVAQLQKTLAAAGAAAVAALSA
jgi:hypothetical protein